MGAQYVYHKLNRTAPHRLWLMTTGGDEVRRGIGKCDPTDFYLLDGLKSEGHTDYVALVHRFVSDGVIGEMDCVYSCSSAVPLPSFTCSPKLSDVVAQSCW